MSKGTTIISDLRSFFSENENNRVINAIMRGDGVHKQTVDERIKEYMMSKIGLASWPHGGIIK